MEKVSSGGGKVNTKLKTVLCILLFAPIWMLLYTLLHEGGHALVILAYGGTIDSFWILGLNAHVSAHGAVYSAFSEALLNVAGVLLPTVVSAVALFFYNPQIKFQGYHSCYFLIAVTPIFTTLVWLIFPILSLFTTVPQGEDVTKFLSVTGFPPLLVAFGALLIVSVFVFLIYRKGLLRKLLSAH